MVIRSCLLGKKNCLYLQKCLMKKKYIYILLNLIKVNLQLRKNKRPRKDTLKKARQTLYGQKKAIDSGTKGMKNKVIKM